jgi:hypothetical protein
MDVVVLTKFYLGIRSYYYHPLPQCLHALFHCQMRMLLQSQSLFILYYIPQNYCNYDKKKIIFCQRYSLLLVPTSVTIISLLDSVSTALGIFTTSSPHCWQTTNTRCTKHSMHNVGQYLYSEFLTVLLPPPSLRLNSCSIDSPPANFKH